MKLKAKYELWIHDLDRAIYLIAFVISIFGFLGALNIEDYWLTLGWFVGFCLISLASSLMVITYYIGIYINILVIQDEREVEKENERKND